MMDGTGGLGRAGGATGRRGWRGPVSCSLSERNVRGMGWPWVVGGLRPQRLGGGGVRGGHFERAWMDVGGGGASVGEKECVRFFLWYVCMRT